MNDKTKPAPAVSAAAYAVAPETQSFAVKQAFWLGHTLCEAGTKVRLTDSQAKRAGEAVEPA